MTDPGNGHLPRFLSHCQGVILDVDGTLVDSNDAHAQAFKEAFAEAGHDVPFEQIRRRIGMGSDKLIPELVGRYDKTIADHKKALFKARYLARVQPFPQVDRLLHALKSRELRLSVASSAARDELQPLLEVAGAQPYLEAQTDSEDAQRSKPAPDIVEAALDRLQLPAERCLMIGDTPYDAEAAARAGVAFIGLRCGGWTSTDLQPSLAVYRDPAELLAAIL